MIRKQGKLPNSITGEEYFKEYQGVSATGGDTLCVPRNIITPGARVLVIDDLMATGVSFFIEIKLIIIILSSFSNNNNNNNFIREQ